MASDNDKIIASLRSQLAELREKLNETQETLTAIRNGEIDAIVVSSAGGDKIFSLASSETPYRLLVEKINEGAVTLNSDGTILYANQSFSNIICSPLEKLVGNNFTNLLPEYERGRFLGLLSKAMSGPAKGDVDATCSTKLINLRLSLSPLPADTQGDISLIVSDITELTNQQNYLREMVEARTTELRSANRLLSEELEKTRIVEKQLQASREKLNIALENGRIGIWEWDSKSNMLFWDERTEKMFGLEKGSFGGTYQDFFNRVHEEDIFHLKETIFNALEKKTSFETVYRTKPVNGKSNFITTKAVVSFDDNGKPTGITGVCMDVTDMKEGAEQALIRLNEELLRSNKDLQQFAYVASHDLQEPLRMVSSFTQLLQMKYHDKLDDEGEEFIRYAVEGSKRMYDLLNGLLAYSRVQSRGKAFSVVDMNNVVEMVEENLSIIISETNAKIITENLPEVYADESQMIQLMQNLIENSIKFRNGVPEITIAGYSDGGQYIISVSDHGIGIDPQFHERIFRIFQRLHRTDEYQGTGIGLSICKRIVERHNGRIWVESEPGKGSTFLFSIPSESSNRFM